MQFESTYSLKRSSVTKVFPFKNRMLVELHRREISDKVLILNIVKRFIDDRGNNNASPEVLKSSKMLNVRASGQIHKQTGRNAELYFVCL